MKSLQWLLAGFFLIVLNVTAVGQSNPFPKAYPPGGRIATDIISSPSFGGASFGVDSVKGSPFSADVAYEFTQVLGDENRIHREWHGKVFRDAEGRVRNEIEDELPLRTNRLHITIQDPVSETFVTLDPQFKRAVVNHITMHTDAAGREIGIGLAADSSPAPGAISPAELLERLKALQQVRRPVPAAIGKKRLGEELGAKEIEGFTAFGIRYSTTTPAGEIGNEKPMVTVNETWWSEDLKAVLVSIYDHPQSGRRVMHLTNIQVGEPDSQLFQVPPDYTVQEFPVRSKTTAKPAQ